MNSNPSQSKMLTRWLLGDYVACRANSERAQSTVEYAVLLLGAAAVAMLVVAWVSQSDVVGRLFDSVFDRIISQQ